MINYLIIFVVKLIFKLLITFFLRKKKLITFLDYCTLSIRLDRNDFSSVCFFLLFLAPHEQCI